MFIVTIDWISTTNQLIVFNTQIFGFIQVASFLRRELPIRLAHRVQDLEKVRMRKRGK